MMMNVRTVGWMAALLTASMACGEVSDPDDPGADPDAGMATDGGTMDPDAMPVEEDVDPPETTLDTVPADPSGTRAGSIAFSSSESGSTFMCKLGVTSFAPCTSPVDFDFDSDGAKMFEVYAIDAAGNADPTPAQHAWVVDTVAPVVTVSSGPSNPTSDGSATLTFSADEVASFECRVDTGAYAACTSPASFTGLADGAHQFDVRATDLAGNVGSDLYAWTVDAAAPSLSITSTPANPTNQTSAAFQFVAEAGTTVTCRIDGGAYVACNSPTTHSFTGLSPNTSHVFEVRAVDGAGNAAVASYTWNIDTIAPVVSILNKPNNPTNSSAAAFTFSVNETATVQCRRDSASFGACATSTSHSYTGLGDGSHTFYVRATDVAGNQATGSYTWTIDTTPPTTTITEAPASPYPVDYATFRFSSNDASATFQCSLNGGSFVACSSPRNYTGLGYVAHDFRVRAVDPLNNVDATPANHAWTAARGLVLHYKLDGDVRNASALGSAHDGSASNATYVDAPNGGGIAFAGDPGSYAKLASTRTPMSNDPAYTIGMWLSDQQAPFDAEERDLFNFLDSGGGIRVHREYSRTGVLQVNFSSDQRVVESGQVQVNATTGWKHVALVYDRPGGDVSVYVNAILSTVIENSRQGHVFGPGQIESMVIGQNSFFVIDELRVYNLALTNKQICEDMMGRLWVEPAGAAAYCK